MIIDTHCHLDDERYNDDLDEVIQNAKDNGVNKIIIPGADVKTLERAVEISEKYEEIYFSPAFELPISRKEIAQYTGLTIETVIRVISSFRRDRLIKVYGKQIEIIDKDALVAIFEHS